MKRFYKTVSVVADEDQGFQLHLDGKAVRTPARHVLIMPTRALADAVAAEWHSQTEQVIPDSMPLSQMAMTLVDRVVPQRDKLTAEVLAYLDTDLVFYRAQDPVEMRDAQEAAWDKFVAWLSQTFVFTPHITTELVALSQPVSAKQNIARSVDQLRDEEFIALYLTTLGAGSLVMALGFVAGAFSGEAVLAGAFVEEQFKDKIYRSDIYGSAPDQERRMRILKTELATLEHFLQLVR